MIGRLRMHAEVALAVETQWHQKGEAGKLLQGFRSSEPRPPEPGFVAR